MPVAQDLTIAATAAAQLGVDAADARLPHLITSASERLAAWLGYQVERRAAATDDCIGGALRLKLSAPAQSITSVVEYGATIAAGDYTLDVDHRSKLGHVRHLERAWMLTGRSSGGASPDVLWREPTGDIVVTYVAGWVTPGQAALSLGTRDMPAALEEAVLVLLDSWLKRRGQDAAVVSLSTGMASVSYASGSSGGRSAMPQAVLDVAAPYRLHQRGGP